jgi:hypothetical protein
MLFIIIFQNETTDDKSDDEFDDVY